MCDGVRVPPLGEHGDRDNAANALSKPARFADGVHHLAEQVLVRELVCIPPGKALAVLLPELLYLTAGDPLEVRAHPLPGLQLSAIDKDGVRARSPPPVLLVAEERQPTGRDDTLAVGELALPAGDVVVHELRHASVGAHHDKDRWGARALLLPAAVRPLVVAVQRVERPFELCGECRRSGWGGFTTLGQVVSDPRPQLSVGGHHSCTGVVRYRYPRYLHDPALDRVDQGEVGHHPREERPLRIARSTQEERCGREVVHCLHPDFCTDCFEPANPETRFLLALLRFRSLVRAQPFLRVGLAAVAVVRLVIYHDDASLGAEITADPARYLIW